MSIKGASQELFVGKKDSKIIDLFGNSTKIFYSDLKKIEYCYFQIGVGGGYLDFVYDSNNVKRPGVLIKCKGGANEYEN